MSIATSFRAGLGQDGSKIVLYLVGGTLAVLAVIMAVEYLQASVTNEETDATTAVGQATSSVGDFLHSLNPFA